MGGVTAQSSNTPCREFLTVVHRGESRQAKMSLLEKFCLDFHIDDSDEEQDKQETQKSQKKRNHGTVHPYPDFNARNDASVLKSAIECKGVDEKVIISILVKRSNEQRQMIKPVYEAMTGESLVKDLESALKRDFEDVTLALLMPPATLDAHLIRKATKRFGTDEEVLIEVLASRTNQQIKDLKIAFKEAYEEELEDVIKHETEGNFAKTLLALLKAERDEGPANKAMARDDAQKLSAALENDIDYDTLINILTKRSWKHLDETIKIFPSIGGYTFGKMVEKKLSRDIEDCLIQIAKCAWNRSAYFAEKLHAAMERHGTCEDTLIRVLVGRSEIDLKKILEQYRLMYGKNIKDAIAEDTRGHHELVLIGLCGPD